MGTASKIEEVRQLQLPALAAFTLLIAVSGWWSIRFAAGPAEFSMLWVPGGILLGALLTAPKKQWPIFLACAFVAFFAVNAYLQRGAAVSLLFSLCNLLDAWCAAYFITKYAPDVAQLASIKRTIRIAAGATFLACLAPALIAASARYLFLSSPTSFWILFETWYASHVIGLIIFSTLTVVSRIEGWRIFGPPKRRAELVVTQLLIALCTWLVFFKLPLPISFALLPLLMVSVLRHRFSGFVPAIALIALIATTATAAGQGPFAHGLNITSEVSRTHTLQLYLLSCCMVAFPAASVLTQRRILNQALKRSEQQYRMLAEHSRDLILRIGPARSLDYISPSVTEMLGWSAEEFERIRWELVHPEDVAVLQDAISPLYAHGGAASAVYRCRHKQGHYVWLAANLQSVPEENGHFAVVYSGRDVTSRIEAEQALEQQARRDPLTGLANRLLFEERMTLALARAKRNRSSVGLLYCDVDFFKNINDSYGHAAGDYALQIFAQRMRQCTRAVDLTVRLGGDEFAILVEDITSSHNLEVIAQKLITTMTEPVTFREVTFKISTSIGIGRNAIGSADAELLLQLADGALYQAKAAGRGTWRLTEAPQD